MARISRAVRIAALVLVLAPRPAVAQVESYFGRPVAEVQISVQGQLTTDPDVSDVLETRVGQPLAAAQVRESIVHLMALGRFDDVQVNARLAAGGGVVLTYALRPLRAVQAIEFKGRLGLPEGDLRSQVVNHFGTAPALSRTAEIRQTLLDLYTDHGYVGTRVTPRPDLTTHPGQVTLTIDIDAGSQARIAKINYVEVDRRLELAEVQRRLRLRQGGAYDPADLTQRITAYTDSLRAKGFYEANISVPPRFSADNTSVALDVTAVRGPRVVLELAGDPVPSAKLDDLAPIKRENSVDKDLIEDWTGNIETYLRTQGYKDATAPAEDQTTGDTRRIVFNVRLGRRYVIDSIEVRGNDFIKTPDLIALLAPVGQGQPFSERTFDQALEKVRGRYRSDGFLAVSVKPEYHNQPGGGVAAVAVAVAVQVVEGPRTTIRSVTFSGNEHVATAELVKAIKTTAGSPYFPPALDDDRGTILVDYLNRGYLLAQVTLADEKSTISADRTRADVRFQIQEGPQIVLDQVLVVGNAHAKTSAIRKALRLLPGEPLGLAVLSEAQQRVAALGLFRRVQVTPLGRGTETKRDVLVTVQEAPATSLAYGGGLEGAKRQRSVNGSPVEVFEIAPRVVFEIGRRNFLGKNRSLNFNGSLAIGAQASGVVGTDLWVYRALGTYREPHVFGAAADLMVTGGVEQAIRPAYTFNRKGVRAELSRTLSKTPTKTVTLYARYGIDNTHVINAPADEQDQISIGRALPNYLLSKVSSSIVRDTRDEPMDPSRGTLTSIDGEVAPQFLGSEVGVAKTLLQGFIYHRLPTKRRIVFAGGVRVGFGTGWGTITVDGTTTPIQGPPLSERFFAGGNTTVRGVAEDTLGTPETLPNGFATGGGSLLILNGELRYSISKSIAAVTFVDAGNVYALASTFDPTNLQPAVGLGFRYKSPLGPIRVDLGFNLRRRVLGTQLEGLTALFIGIGQAF